MHLSQQVPLIPAERRMRLAPVATARHAARPRSGWCALFVKAYAIVAARRPELRRAYVSFPWPHLYEHPGNVASVAIERNWGQENAVFIGSVRSPEEQSLTEIEARLRRYKEQPVESISAFRQILTISGLPRPLRRLAWWYGYHVSGWRRAKQFGTFGISVAAGAGGSFLSLLSPLTTTLNYGVLDEDGTLDVRLNFDHRVLDGATAVRALEELERVLHCEILAELRQLCEAAAV